MEPLHPRRASYLRYWERRREAAKRFSPGTLMATRVRTDQPGWVDYFPDFPGTVVEKILFSLLVEKKVSFYFGAYWGDMPFTPEDQKRERYRPDFILPEFRIVIDIYGYYWHSRKGQYAKDAVKAAWYEASGYKYIILWDYEIYARPYDILDSIPELRHPVYQTNHVYVAKRPLDPRRALQSRMSNRVRVVRTHYRPYKRKKLTPLRSYKPFARGAKQLYEDTDWATPFTGWPDADRERFRAYGVQFEQYIKNLGTFLHDFQEDWPGIKPSWWNYYWWYWAKWADWFNRWDRFSDEAWVDYFEDLDVYFNYFPEAYNEHWRQYYHWKQWETAGVYRVW